LPAILSLTTLSFLPSGTASEDRGWLRNAGGGREATSRMAHAGCGPGHCPHYDVHAATRNQLQCLPCRVLPRLRRVRATPACLMYRRKACLPLYAVTYACFPSASLARSILPTIVTQASFSAFPYLLPEVPITPNLMRYHTLNPHTSILNSGTLNHKPSTWDIGGVQWLADDPTLLHATAIGRGSSRPQISTG
jgi:hypothetical protein